MNLAYFSPTIATNLFSIGYIQRSGGSHHTASTDQLYYVYATDKLLLNSPIMIKSNLYPVDFNQLSTALRDIPSSIVVTTVTPHVNTAPSAVANAAIPHINTEQR